MYNPNWLLPDYSLIVMKLQERIIVIGSSGSGKSTLARELGRRLGLPIIHLDYHFWNAGWVQTAAEEWPERVKALVEGDRWIIDGNYSSTLDIRLAAAETVIYLDMPRWLCMWRVLKRWFTHLEKTRPDLPEGCPEKIDLEFLRWTWNYPTRSRPATLERLRSVQLTKQVIWLKSPREVMAFVEGLEAGSRAE